ncbi:uncharacterized protein EV420DRAFT_1533052 [Desarmillaria tabescens]|uniref:Uncharacterized protein n=1 Tax=Armillaria tabescens TaxID=1929756 RepID=A0AA39N7R2_ARMTA|nr:uncharacterized protein EV420DRAFT_1533052 [Desarmillaria tabescens]KAK0460582.1 hypothetical protein EV420DRAFT_1533052 [Desarmillaria tabescens]
MFTAARIITPKIPFALRKYTKQTPAIIDGPGGALTQGPQTDKEPSQGEDKIPLFPPPKRIPKRLLRRVTFIHGNILQHLEVLEELRKVEKLLPFCLHPNSKNIGHVSGTEPPVLKVESKAFPTLDEVQYIIDTDGMRFIRHAKAQTSNLQGLMESLERDPECMRLPIVIDWTTKQILLDRLSRMYPKTVYREKKIKERQVLKWLVEGLFPKAKQRLWSADTSNAAQVQKWFDTIRAEIKLRKSLFIQTYGDPFDR